MAQAKTKRHYWSDSVSRYDLDSQRLDNARDIIAALSGCDACDIPDSQCDDGHVIHVRSNDDAMLRRFRRR